MIILSGDLTEFKDKMNELAQKNGLVTVEGTITSTDTFIEVELENEVYWAAIMGQAAKSTMPFLMIEAALVSEEDLEDALPIGSVTKERYHENFEEVKRKVRETEKVLSKVKVGDLYNFRVGVAVGQILFVQTCYAEWHEALLTEWDDYVPESKPPSEHEIKEAVRRIKSALVEEENFLLATTKGQKRAFVMAKADDLGISREIQRMIVSDWEVIAETAFVQAKALAKQLK